MARKFTKEEIEELEKNPNTLKATASHLSLTKSAKEEVLALVREGLSAYQIVKKLGYDAEMLGKSRCDGIRYCVLKEDEAGHEQREGYEATVDGFDITNTHTPETEEPVETKITISGEKIWDDEDDKDGIRPENVTIQLIADGTQMKRSLTISEGSDGRWLYSFTDLDAYTAKGTKIRYTVQEAAVEGYEATVDGYNITNKHTVSATPTPVPGGDVTTTPIPGGEDAQKVIIAGEAIWDDENDKDGIRPEVIIINLKRNGETIGSKYVRESDGWSWMFEGQAKADANGNAYTYTFTEDEVEGYKTTVDGGIITNTHTPAEGDGEHDPLLYIQGEIFWVDDNNAEGKRPDSVDVTLYLQGQAVQTVTVTEGFDGRWLYEMDPVKRFYIQENTRARLMASGAKMKAA